MKNKRAITELSNSYERMTESIAFLSSAYGRSHGTHPQLDIKFHYLRQACEAIQGMIHVLVIDLEKE